MTTRSEREKAEKLNEQHQAILSKLLKEEDNRYCADCEAKGPRWASWNLGVFMCIRCAGIHRNLGVHISRVKSVNLDQWTPEQIQSMVDMGNGRAKRLYEAHLPENFMRPQSDQAVEVLIRDKYERKKYYDKEAAAAIAQQKSANAVASSTSPSNQADKNKPEKERDKKKEDKKSDRRTTTKSEGRVSPKKEASVDLLGLESPESPTGQTSSAAAKTGQEADVFGPLVSNPLPAQTQSGSCTAPQQADPSTSSSPSSSTATATNTRPEEKKLLSKDSILSLYASSSVGSSSQSQQQQPAPGQGTFVGQTTMQFGQGGGGPVPTPAMMGGGAILSGMTLPNGSYTGQQQGQWTMNQVTQQMSAVTVSSSSGGGGGGGGGGPAPAPGFSAAAPSSGQTLSTQLWK